MLGQGLGSEGCTYIVVDYLTLRFGGVALPDSQCGGGGMWLLHILSQLDSIQDDSGDLDLHLRLDNGCQDQYLYS